MGCGGLQGYVCVPDGHNKASDRLQSMWRDSVYIDSMYFATATFSSESRSYFPNYSNHYLIAFFRDGAHVVDDLDRYASDYMSFLFPTQNPLFERPSMAKLNYVSLYYIKQSYNRENVDEISDVFIRRRERLRSANFANMQVIPSSQVKFTFPYANDLILLEIESEKSHQSDQKYCERTRNEVIKKGININNLVSFSILSEIK